MKSQQIIFSISNLFLYVFLLISMPCNHGEMILLVVGPLPYAQK
jgi:hypothetical protein